MPGRRGRKRTGKEVALTFGPTLLQVVYQRILQLSYIDDLLSSIKELFTSLFAPFVRALLDSSRATLSANAVVGTAALGSKLRADFAETLKEWEDVFSRTLRQLERLAAQNKRKNLPPAAGEKKGAAAAAVLAAEHEMVPPSPTPDGTNDASEIARNVEALKNRLKADGPGGRKGLPMGKGKKGKGATTNGAATPGSGPGSGADTPTTPGGKKGKPIKEMRKWGDSSKVTARDVAALDFSGAAEEPSVHNEDRSDLSGWVDERGMGERREDGLYELADAMDGGDEDEEAIDEDDEDEDRTADSKLGGGGLLSRFTSASGLASTSSFFSLGRLTGNKTLTKEDLAPALAGMQAHLQSKNVAADVAARLCESVERGLVGRSVRGLGGVRAAVRGALEDSITRILTPRTSTDILLEISSKRARVPASAAVHASAKDRELAAKPEPYAIAFVGVNGVGKSTNLAKVCFWLLQNRLRVLIAACDTFRSGAVEQLRVHVRNLSQLDVAGSPPGEGARVELYERGYGKDAAGIAKDALAYARGAGFDVVLIDTAGRMQDNEPLMRALAKLVAVNSPDKIIFVGEALVGNEAVDQLTKFDKALKDFSGVSRPRGLDGMLLTKWDTVDDKVGTALSATAATGQPIFFVGVGQVSVSFY